MRVLGTLRRRIAFILVVLLLVVAVATDLTTTALLRSFLVGRLDAQLGPAASRFASSLTESRGQLSAPDRDGDDDGDDATPGQSVGTLTVLLPAGAAASAVTVDVAGKNQPVELDRDDVRGLESVPADQRPHDLSIDDLGAYRVVSTEVHGGNRMITGLPLRGIDDTLTRLVLIETIVLLVAVITAAMVAAWLVGRTLAPLRRMTRLARDVSDLPLTEQGTALPGALAISRPTTEVDQLSVAFDHMLDHLRSALSDRDDTETRLRHFIADTSHELRTPLATIRAFTEYAQADASGAAHAVALDRIDAATIRMGLLVEDLLLLARLDDGRPLAQVRVDLTQITAEAVMDVRTRAPGHRFQLSLPEAAIELTGDGDRLHQLLINLLVNAQNHTPAGTTVTTELITRPDAIVLCVADDGPGIPPEIQEHLFERFIRGDATPHSEIPGTGLGLAIARGIAEAHLGTLNVTSTPGRTEFRVELPRRREPGS